MRFDRDRTRAEGLAPAAQRFPQLGREFWPAGGEIAGFTNATVPDGAWTFAGGGLTAGEDQVIWALGDRPDFQLDFECKTGPDAKRGAQPPIPGKFGDAPLPDRSVFYCGDRGIIVAEGGYTETPRLLPDEKMQGFRERRPETAIPRVPGGNARSERTNARKDGPKPGSDIVDYSAALAELVLAGNLAARMGRPMH